MASGSISRVRAESVIFRNMEILVEEARDEINNEKTMSPESTLEISSEELLSKIELYSSLLHHPTHYKVSNCLHHNVQHLVQTTD